MVLLHPVVVDARVGHHALAVGLGEEAACVAVDGRLDARDSLQPGGNHLHSGRRVAVRSGSRELPRCDRRLTAAWRPVAGALAAARGPGPRRAPRGGARPGGARPRQPRAAAAAAPQPAAPARWCAAARAWSASARSARSGRRSSCRSRPRPRAPGWSGAPRARRRSSAAGTTERATRHPDRPSLQWARAPGRLRSADASSDSPANAAPNSGPRNDAAAGDIVGISAAIDRAVFCAACSRRRALGVTRERRGRAAAGAESGR